MNNVEIIKDYFSPILGRKKDEVFLLIENNVIETIKGSDNMLYEILEDSFGIYLSFLDN